MSSNRKKDSSKTPRTPQIRSNVGKQSSPSTVERSRKPPQHKIQGKDKAIKYFPGKFGTSQNISFKNNTKQEASRYRRKYAESKGIPVSEGSVSLQTESDVQQGPTTPTVSVHSNSMGGFKKNNKTNIDYSLINSILKSFGADCNCKNPKNNNRKRKNHISKNKSKKSQK